MLTARLVGSPAPRGVRSIASFQPSLVVMGIGGGGGNGVSHMVRQKLEGVEFVACNTDAQALATCHVPTKIKLGSSPLGAGANPEVGRLAAEASLPDLRRVLEGKNMVFLAAGMGGGTGTGALPVIAKLAREMEILTVAVVTKPFFFEGAQRERRANAGIEVTRKCVDTMIVVPNENLLALGKNVTLKDAFARVDQVLFDCVRGVTDLIVKPGLVNLDFADVNTVLHRSGPALMGIGQASGHDRAEKATLAALSNPLLEVGDIANAAGVLISITGGRGMTLHEIAKASNVVRSCVSEEAQIIFGSTFDDSIGEAMRVSVIVTGFDPVKDDQAVVDVSPSPVAAGAAASPKSVTSSRAPASSQASSPLSSSSQSVSSSPAFTAADAASRLGRRLPTESVAGLTGKKQTHASSSSSSSSSSQSLSNAATGSLSSSKKAEEAKKGASEEKGGGGGGGGMFGWLRNTVRKNW